MCAASFSFFSFSTFALFLLLCDVQNVFMLDEEDECNHRTISNPPQRLSSSDLAVCAYTLKLRHLRHYFSQDLYTFTAVALVSSKRALSYFG